MTSEIFDKNLKSFEAEINLFIKQAKHLFDQSCLNQTVKVKEGFNVLFESLGNLKSFNRLFQNSLVKYNQQASLSKKLVDEETLKLAAIHYQAGHVSREISIAKDFSSKFSNLQLIDIDTFKLKLKEEAHLNNPHNLNSLNGFVNKDIDDEHQFHIARLNFELQERKRLVSHLSSLRLECDDISSWITNSNETLLTLSQELSQLNNQARKSLSIFPFPEMIPVESIVQYLPGPLYNIYHSVKVFEHMMNDLVQVQIKGDYDLARNRRLNKNQSRQSQVTNPVPLPLGNTMDMDLEDSNNSSNPPLKDEGQGHEQKNEKTNLSNNFESSNSTQDNDGDNDDSLLALDALSVCVTFKLENSSLNDSNANGESLESPSISLTFQYLTNLKFITVLCNSNLLNSENKADLANILINIFPNDDGSLPYNICESKIFSNSISQLLKSNITLKGLQNDNSNGNGKLFIPGKMGMCFKWAQTLAGLYFTTPSNNDPNFNLTSTDLNTNSTYNNDISLADLRERIIKRVFSRLSLQQQFSSLFKKTYLPNIIKNNNNNNNDPQSNLAELLEFKELEQSQSLSSSLDLENDYYGASFKSSSSGTPDGPVLLAKIKVPKEYPLKPPAVQLKVVRSNLQSSYDMDKDFLNNSDQSSQTLSGHGSEQAILSEWAGLFNSVFPYPLAEMVALELPDAGPANFYLLSHQLYQLHKNVNTILSYFK